MAEEQDALGGLQDTLRDLQEMLATGKMDALGVKQGQLDAAKEKLREVWEEMIEVDHTERETSRRMQEFLDNALAKGPAQPE